MRYTHPAPAPRGLTRRPSPRLHGPTPAGQAASSSSRELSLQGELPASQTRPPWDLLGHHLPPRGWESRTLKWALWTVSWMLCEPQYLHPLRDQGCPGHEKCFPNQRNHCDAQLCPQPCPRGPGLSVTTPPQGLGLTLQPRPQLHSCAGDEGREPGVSKGRPGNSSLFYLQEFNWI